MGKENVGHLYNAVLFSLKEGRRCDTYHTWVNLEDTVPSDVNQPQKDKYCMTSPMAGP